MERIINCELTKVSDWIKVNKLSLNISKTNFMISHPLMSNPANINILIDNCPINHCNETKFLGVLIDSKLLWRQHIQEITSKVSRLTGILYKIRNSITSDCLKLVYMSLAYPHFLYCSAIWGGAYNTYCSTLFTAQKNSLE